MYFLRINMRFIYKINPGMSKSQLAELLLPPQTVRTLSTCAAHIGIKSLRWDHYNTHECLIFGQQERCMELLFAVVKKLWPNGQLKLDMTICITMFCGRTFSVVGIMSLCIHYRSLGVSQLRIEIWPISCTSPHIILHPVHLKPFILSLACLSG